MLYIGAGDDPVPLHLECARRYDAFVFVDALPALPHYAPGQLGYAMSLSEDRMVRSMRETDARLGARVAAGEIEDGVWKTRLADGRPLMYYFNTADTAMARTPGLREVLPAVTGLFVAGFLPDDSVWSALPHLRHCHVVDTLLLDVRRSLGRGAAGRRVQIQSAGREYFWGDDGLEFIE